MARKGQAGARARTRDNGEEGKGRSGRREEAETRQPSRAGEDRTPSAPRQTAVQSKERVLSGGEAAAQIEGLIAAQQDGEKTHSVEGEPGVKARRSAGLCGRESGGSEADEAAEEIMRAALKLLDDDLFVERVVATNEKVERAVIAGYLKDRARSAPVMGRGAWTLTPKERPKTLEEAKRLCERLLGGK